MNPDKKKQEVDKTKADAIETPPPPQHMDPSKKPAQEKDGKGKPAKKSKKSVKKSSKK